MSKRHVVDFLLFRDVTNAGDVRQACVAGNFRTSGGSVAIVKASMIVDLLQLKAAVAKAVAASQSSGEGAVRMKTRALDTEIVYYLSVSKSISDSLKQVVQKIKNHFWPHKFCLGVCHRVLKQIKLSQK
jgi:hypothetical protein